MSEDFTTLASIVAQHRDWLLSVTVGKRSKYRVIIFVDETEVWGLEGDSLGEISSRLIDGIQRREAEDGDASHDHQMRCPKCQDVLSYPGADLWTCSCGAVSLGWETNEEGERLLSLSGLYTLKLLESMGHAFAVKPSIDIMKGERVSGAMTERSEFKIMQALIPLATRVAPRGDIGVDSCVCVARCWMCSGDVTVRGFGVQGTHTCPCGHASVMVLEHGQIEISGASRAGVWES